MSLASFRAQSADPNRLFETSACPAAAVGSVHTCMECMTNFCHTSMQSMAVWRMTCMCCMTTWALKDAPNRT